MADDGIIQEHERPLVKRAIEAWNHASKTNDPDAWLVAADACEEGGYPDSAKGARFHAERAERMSHQVSEVKS